MFLMVLTLADTMARVDCHEDTHLEMFYEPELRKVLIEYLL